MKEDDVCMELGTNVGVEKCTRDFVGKPKERNNCEDL